MVVLATPIAVKVTGGIPWIHHTRVKKAVASCDEDTWKAVWDPPKSPQGLVPKTIALTHEGR